jgi:hypothetical protein
MRIAPLLPLLLAACASAVRPAGSGAEAEVLRTRAERTGFRETTTHAEALRLMEAAAARSPLVHLSTYGHTAEGRSMTLAVVGRVPDASPGAVRASGRTVVYLQGNIHAGEVEGKEALLALLREAGEGRYDAVLDSLVLVVAPIYNADGNEAVAPGNRPLQHGPVVGMGTRATARGLDLNRDHTKLDSPEARALAALLVAYDPHLTVDLHTTNGTRHAYHLTYAPPLHPNTPEPIDRLLRERWLPDLDAVMRADHGWLTWHYGNVPPAGGGAERG